MIPRGGSVNLSAKPLLFLWLGLLAASPTAAQEATRVGRYRVRPAVDVPVLILAGTGWAAPGFFLDDLVDPSCPCDPSDLPSLDRWSIDHRSDGLDLVSDVGLGMAIAAPFALDALAARGSQEGWERFAEDAVVMGEALLVSGALTQLTKLLVQRPRPHLYRRSPDDPELLEPRNYLGFPSAHVSTVMTIGLSAARTYSLHHPDGPHEGKVYAAAILGGGAMGALRVFSGRHFTTDVLAGVAIGTAAGLAVPWLHTRADATGLGFAGPGGAGVIVRLAVD